MTIYRHTWLLLATLSFMGCGRQSINSDLKQMDAAWDEEACAPTDQARTSEVVAASPKEVLVGWTSKPALDVLHRGLAALPNSYFQKLMAEDSRIRQYNNEEGSSSARIRIIAKDTSTFKSAQTGGGGIAIGLTYVIQNRNSNRPLFAYKMEILPNPGYMELSVMHEIGHALEGAVIDAAGESFMDDIAKVSAQEANNPRLSWYPMGYHKQGDMNGFRREFFAEAFQSYYCNKRTHQGMKETFPSTYALIRSKLLAPRWEQPSSTPGDKPSTPSTDGGSTSIAKDIKVALTSKSDGSRLLISAPKSTKEVVYCLGGSTYCESDSATWYKANAVTLKNKAVAYRSSGQPLMDTDAKQVAAIIAVKQSDGAWTRRTLTFKRK